MALRAQILISALILALATGLWFGAGLTGDSSATPAAGKGGKTRPATPVIVERIERIADRILVKAVGTGEAERNVTLHPEVSGLVTEVAFQGEQQVAAGDVLLRLEDRDERLAVELARVDVAEARRQVNRFARLAPKGAISQVQLDTARATLSSATLRLAQAEAALDDRMIRAPFSGVVGMTDVHVGDRVTDETMVASMDDRSSIRVTFAVPEDHAGKIKPGDRISAKAWSLGDRVFTGKIVELGSRIDPATRTLQVRARLPNPEGLIRPGTSFAVTLAIAGETYPAVYEVAVLWSRDGAYVWKVEEETARRVGVTIIRRKGGRILVDGDLEAGDLVVVEGVQGLRDGRPVRLRETLGPGETPAGGTS